MAQQAALEAKKRGNAHFVKQEWDAAIKEFTAAIELDSTQHVFFSNRSACHAGLSNYDAALSDANQCIEIKPEWAKGYSRKGCALFGLGKLEEAKKAYQAGLEIDPENGPLKDGLKDVEDKIGAQNNPFNQMFGDSLWAKIAMNPKTKPYLDDQAFVQKVKLLQSNPQTYMTMFMKDPQMMEVIQLVFSDMGINFGGPPPAGPDSSGAGGSDFVVDDDDSDNDDVGIVKDAKDDDKPTSSATSAGAPAPTKKAESKKSEEEQKKTEADEIKQKGNALYKKRKFDEAIVEYTKAIELMPESPVYLTNRSAVYFMQGDYDKSIADCKEAIEIARRNYAPLEQVAKCYTRMGDIAMKKKEYPEAIELYNKSLLEESNYKVKKKLKEAENLKAKADKEAYLDEEKALFHKGKGNELFKEQKWSAAADEYTESIKRNPNDHKVWSNRAAVYSKLMAWDYAMRDCNEAIKIDPTFAKSYLRKGKIEHFRKEYQKALATYNKGLEHEPDSSQLLESKAATMRAVSMANKDKADPERQARALADPEVQKILKDPSISKVLEQMQANPMAAQSALADPEIRKKIEVLVAAGIIQVR